MSVLEPKAPDFANMEVSSVSVRKSIDKSFLVICVFISLISIVILAILLAAIVAKAIPTFAPHTDRYEAENRTLFVDGSQEANSEGYLDGGDLVQGVIDVNHFFRGGLGKENDEDFAKANQLVGVYSFEIADSISPGIFRLQPASGENNVVAMAKQAGINVEDVDAGSAAILILQRNNDGDFSIADAKVDGQLLAENGIGGLISGDQWSPYFVGGFKAENDFAALDMSAAMMVPDDANELSDFDKVAKVRTNKRGGRLKCLCSIFTHPYDSPAFKPVKLRTMESTGEILSGQLKIDETDFSGLSRRKKNGFNLGGTMNVKFCPVPEDDASTAAHIQHFLTETNKSEPSEAGIGPALMGTLWICVTCALLALPLGVGTAIFLEEFKPTNRFLLWLHSLIQINISNLAGVPSIVYGILGLTAFAGMFGLMGSSKEPSVEFGVQHYYQYLTEGNSPVLIPVDPENRKMGHKVQLMARKQKQIFNAKTAIGNPKETNVANAIKQNEKFLKHLEELQSKVDREDNLELAKNASTAVTELLAELKGSSSVGEETKSAAKKVENLLIELAELIQTPLLTDGMDAFSADKEPLTIKVLGPDDDYPEDDETLAVTLYSDSVGGSFADKRWYYFQLPFGRSVLAASLTLMLVILPVIIIASQESLKAVPPSLRECALGLGATPWQVVRQVTLPAAIPGIMTGAILSMSRAIGEAAPILIICGILFATAGPSNLMDLISILPIQIYNTTKLPVDNELLIHSQNVAAAGIVVLLAILLTFNALAIAIRQWTQKPLS